MNSKRYIGDGVYVDFDGFSLWLTTEDGISVTNRICLEPQVYAALTQYVGSLAAALASRGGEPSA